MSEPRSQREGKGGPGALQTPWQISGVARYFLGGTGGIAASVRPLEFSELPLISWSRAAKSWNVLPVEPLVQWTLDSAPLQPQSPSPSSLSTSFPTPGAEDGEVAFAVGCPGGDRWASLPKL